MSKDIRVRFAPSPTGFMHLGNVRTAVLNFLFARRHNGTNILRIEDTDPLRNVDPEGKILSQDLAWLGITFDEGPAIGGAYAPYFQSKRSDLYTEALNTLKAKDLIYPCFCSSEELERKRARQLAMKQPPRYDRACLSLSKEKVKENFSNEVPFIWRFQLDYSKTVTFYDMAHKTMEFELQHFSDLPLTRQDGSFTFLFANFVDDVAMKITHVFRGEDHLTNTATQVALYEAFEEEIPVFWHLPILCNLQGKKLSKRDFGFSLADLKNDGFLPEALVNYLGIIGHSVNQEIMSMQELIDSFNFEHLSPTGQIKYDVEKLRWVNHQWIMKYDRDALVELCRPYISAELPTLGALPHDDLKALLGPLQEELVTLKQSAQELAFIISKPPIEKSILTQYNVDTYKGSIKKALPTLVDGTPLEMMSALKAFCTTHAFPLKDVCTLYRIALTGKAHGPALKDLLGMLTPEEIASRITQIIS